MIEIDGELYQIKKQYNNVIVFYLNNPFYIFNNILVDTGIKTI
jgi:hypothetical protein